MKGIESIQRDHPVVNLGEINCEILIEKTRNEEFDEINAATATRPNMPIKEESTNDFLRQLRGDYYDD